jgi:choice-of-anchor C domain-containing protein
MRTSAIILVSAAAACAFGVNPIAHAGTLLINGSFEEGPRVGQFLTLTGGSTALPGWTVLGTSIDIVGTGWQQVDGAKSIDLDGTPGPGGVEQTFATVPGQWYSVSLQMAGNPQCGPTIKEMSVSAAGQSTTMSFDVTGFTFQDMGWEERNWCFLADDRQTTLAFMSLTGGPTPCGPAIDLVAVEPSGGPSLGDLNCDQLVDGADLGLLLGAWGDCANCISCIADLNGDCEVDGGDLGLLLGAWTG